MSRQWTILMSTGLELNCYHLDSHDAALQMIQDELDEGYFDLDDFLIEEIETQ